MLDPEEHRLGPPAEPAGAMDLSGAVPAAGTSGIAPPGDASGAVPAAGTSGTGPPGDAGGPRETAERQRQRAFDVAWRHLAQRDRTEAEILANFERKGVHPALADEVLGELREGAYVDDAAYARRFAEDRRNLDGWGAERIERRLIQLGVGREEIRAALASGNDHDELSAACELLARRFPVPPDTPKDRDRALGFLVRKGYELGLAYDALRRHAGTTVDG